MLYKNSINLASSSKQNRQKNTERRKMTNLLFNKIGRKCRLLLIRSGENNDHARIMHKIQFWYSFKRDTEGKLKKDLENEKRKKN